MKITIQRTELLERLAQVSKAVASKSTIPILEGVLLKSDAVLTIIGSDSNFSISTTIDDYQEHESGSIVLPAKQLLEVVRKMPDKELSIEVGANNATLIKCGGTKVTLPGMDSDMYPTQQVIGSGGALLERDTFERMVADTAFSASKNEAMPILTGVCITVDSGTVQAVATDRHRLAQFKASVDSDESLKAVIPVKVLDTAAQLKSDTTMSLLGNKIQLQAGDYTFTTSTLDGSYPDTSRITKTDPTLTLRSNTQDLLRALELARVTTDQRTRVVTMDIGEDKVHISARGEGGSSMEKIIEADVDGEELRISANSEFMIEALKRVQEETVEFQFTDAMSPMILKGVDNETSFFLVLPYRTLGS